METIWIIGSGRFGIRAARQLANRRDKKYQDKKYTILVVDQDKASLDKARDLGCGVEAGDGVRFLYENLERGRGPDWVVPAVPVHLAWEWCRLRLGGALLMPVVLPGAFDALVPNPMRGKTNEVYVSHADFLCPSNCNEPEDYCTRTGEPRKTDMFQYLAGLNFPGVTPFVIQSVQLGPGTGGYSPEALFDLVDRLAQHKGDCFAATACRCHGVVSGGRVLPGRSRGK